MHTRYLVTNAQAVRIADNTARFSRAIVSCEDNHVRYTVDGTEPTVELGHFLYATGTLVLTNGVEIAQFRMIASGSDASVQVTLT